MIRPEALREELVHEIVWRVLDHLDLFEDDLLLLLDIFRIKVGCDTRSVRRSTATGRCSSSTFT